MNGLISRSGITLCQSHTQCVHLLRVLDHLVDVCGYCLVDHDIFLILRLHGLQPLIYMMKFEWRGYLDSESEPSSTGRGLSKFG